MVRLRYEFFLQYIYQEKSDPYESICRVYVCALVCVCAHVTADFRGQFCVFNPLTGDIRKVGTSPVVFTIPINFLSHFGHV